MTDKNATDTTQQPKTTVRRSWWPGWIWTVPIAAFLIVGWLAMRALTSGGEDITISFADVHGLDPGNSSILYRGMKVGRVTGVSLAKDGKAVDVDANIQDSASRFLRSHTRFWLRGANPGISNLSALGNILSGPSIVMDPGGGNKTTQFSGTVGKPVIPADAGKPHRFDVELEGSTGGLKSGDKVMLRGFTVGEVTDVRYHLDPETGDFTTPVTLALYPSLFHIEQTGPHKHTPAALPMVIDTLIKKGLRARLQRDPPIIGKYFVALDIEPETSSAGVTPRKDGTALPQIPSTPSDSLGSIVSRLNGVPVDRIARNLLNVTRQIDTLVSSPKLTDAVAQLDGALKQIRHTAARSGPQLTRLIKTLHHTAADLDRAAQSANRVTGGGGAQNDLKKTMREITEAARAVRELADYLDRHPEALIQGRSER